MTLTRKQKENAVAEITTLLSGDDTVVFTAFHGIGTGDMNALRGALRTDGVAYRVVKKTLARRALAAADVSGETPELPAELAFASGKETAPARGVYGFEKQFAGGVSILGGIFQKKFVGREAMVAIAQIPSLLVLRGMFANIINSPIQRFAVALGEIAKTKAGANA